MTWTSSNGIELRDLVPVRLRRAWVAQGHCPDRDLYSLFQERVRKHPHRTAVIDDDGALDYAALGLRVSWLASALTGAGLGPLDIIGISVHNGRDAVIAELAVAAVGAVALPFPTSSGRADAISLLGRSKASAVIVDRQLGVRLPFLRRVFVLPMVGDEFAFEALTRPRVDPEAPARILTSSGSEAEPKMIAYSHNAIAGGRGNYIRAVHRDTPIMRDLLLVSLSSAYGSFGATITLCRFGGTLVLPRRFDAASVLRAIARHRPTHVFAVPTMLRRMVEIQSGVDMSSVRAIVSSTDVLPPETLAACRSVFRTKVINIYGSSDGVNCHTAMPENGVGRPDPAVTAIRIVKGEVCALGPMTPLCYVGAPELDAAYRMPGGWVRTGDHGRIDADGTLHVIRRLKALVKRGGHTISPAEVELALGGYPGVFEVVCVPVPDPDLGERLCACVTVRRGHPSPRLEQLVAYLADTCGMTTHKLPEFLLVLSEFPLGRTDKICRRALTVLAARHFGRGT
jgi:acyl-CoA synthetase (AMP-forming)/AMP-acid ligase II